MRMVPLLLCIFLGIAGPIAAEDNARDFIPVIATSGRIEIRSLQLSRSLITGHKKVESRPTLQISLLIAPRPPLAELPPVAIEIPMAETPAFVRRVEPLLVRFADLQPIEDDTGHLLSTKERLAAMPVCNEDMEVGNAFPADENMSFSVGLKLDAPARPATKIKLLKGKLVVSKRKIAALGFKDLAALDGRPLVHPKLKDFEIRATLKTAGQKTRVDLTLPRHHSRVALWGLAKGGEMLPMIIAPDPFGTTPPPFGPPLIHSETEESREYVSDAAKDAILGIALVEPVEWQVFPFEFKDLELP